MAILNRFYDAPTPYVAIQDFSGGMNNQDNAIAIADNQLVQGLNVYGFEQHGLTKRPGSYKDSVYSIGSGTTRIWSEFRYYTPSFTKTIVGVDTLTGGKVFEQTPSGYTEITGGTALTAGNRIRFINYRDTLLIFNGSQFQYYTGNTPFVKADVTFKAAVPSMSASASICITPKILAIKDESLWAVGAIGSTPSTCTQYDRNTIYFTNPDAWGAGDPKDMNFPPYYNLPDMEVDSDKHGITALKAFPPKNSLFVIRDYDIHEVVGTDTGTYQFILTTGDAGATSQEGVVLTNDDRLIMAGVDEFYELNATGGSPIGWNIKPDYVGADTSQLCGEFLPQFGIVIFGGQDRSFIYDTRTPAWYEWSLAISSIHRYKYYLDFNKAVFSVYGSPYLYYFDPNATQDDGNSFLVSIASKIYTVNGLANLMQFRGVKCLYSSDHSTGVKPFDFTVNINNGQKTVDVTLIDVVSGDNWDVSDTGQDENWDEMNWAGGDFEIGAAGLTDDCQGNFMQFFIEMQNDSKLIIHGIAFESEPMPKRVENR